jgi:hypothetical protein
MMKLEVAFRNFANVRNKALNGSTLNVVGWDFI